MRDCGKVSMRLGDTVGLACSGADFASEKAVIPGELDRKDGHWRFGAVGQGFDGGLSALLKHFGGVEAPAARSRRAPSISISAACMSWRTAGKASCRCSARLGVAWTSGPIFARRVTTVPAPTRAVNTCL
jgi:hypothetical protein